MKIPNGPGVGIPIIGATNINKTPRASWKTRKGSLLIRTSMKAVRFTMALVKGELWQRQGRAVCISCHFFTTAGQENFCGLRCG